MPKSTQSQASGFYRDFTELLKQIHGKARFEEIFPELEAQIHRLFQAERLTIYQRSLDSPHIYSRYKSGSEVSEIRVPINTGSIAGFAALSQKTVCISDVHDQDQLRKLHANLKFDARFDRQTGFTTRSVVAVPIINEDVLLGVLQIINHKGGKAFDKEYVRRVEEFAHFIGVKLRQDFGGAKTPYDYLAQQGLLNESQVKQIKSQCKTDAQCIDFMRRQAAVPKAQLGRSLEAYYQVPFVAYDPDKYALHPRCSKINLSYLRKNNVAILERRDGRTLVVVEQPGDGAKLVEIEAALGSSDYDICVGLTDDIQQYLGVSGGGTQVGALDDILGEFDAGEELEETDEASISEEEPAVVRLVNRVLHDGQRLDASDIHIEPSKGRTPAVVRMRVDGLCKHILEFPASHLRAVVSRIKIMSRLDIAERRKPQDGKFAIKLNGRNIEVRVATLPTVNGEGVVMRILPAGGAMPYEKLNMTSRNYQILDKLIQHPHGILLVVGPTGSGKTTTLHAILGKLNTPEKKVWTAEDPVEITQSGLQQMQMRPKIGLNFASALRSFLRADPDIILIGEMRDAETAEAGVEASLTGHLVLSTLHTNSAPETITRLIDIGLDAANFAEACLGVLAQRLVRTLCSECKEAYEAPLDEKQFLIQQYDQQYIDDIGVAADKPLTLYRGKGCDACGDSGYKGRAGIHELLQMTPGLRAMIYQQKTASELKQQAMQDGMRTLLQDGIVKVLEGQTDVAQLRLITAMD